MFDRGADMEIVTATTYTRPVKILNEYAIMDYPVSGDALAIIREAKAINEDPTHTCMTE